jgi:hypothetical protein
VQRLLDAITTAPAWVRNARMDFLAANRLGYALYSELFADPIRPVNNARFVFLNPRAQAFYANWERGADDVVAILRTEAGRNPYDRDLSDLIGELSMRSETFRTRWASHNVRFHRTGIKRIHHPVVGDVELTYEATEFPADPGLTMFVYTAEPGSASEDALKLLARAGRQRRTSRTDSTPRRRPTASRGRPTASRGRPTASRGSRTRRR